MTVQELIEYLVQLPQDMEVWKIEEDGNIIPIEEEDLAELNTDGSVDDEEDDELQFVQKVLIINFESSK